MKVALDFGSSKPLTPGSVRLVAFGVRYHEGADGVLRSSDGAVFGRVDHEAGIVLRTVVHPSIRYQLKHKGRPGWKHLRR